MKRISLVLGAVLCLAACRQPTDRVASESLYRAFKRMSGATMMGVSKMSYDAVLQDAATELLVLSDLAPSTGDSAVVRHYMGALEKYKDAGSLWATQIEDVRYDWIPKGRIYITNPAIVSRYKLPTETHPSPSGGKPFETVSSESIQAIWSLAKADCDSAEGLVLPKLRKSYR